jgi:hypothetical protein
VTACAARPSLCRSRHANSAVLRHARKLLRAEVVADDVCEVSAAIARIEAQVRGFALRDLARVSHPILLRPVESPLRRTEFDTAADGPHRVDHRQISPFRPLRAQVVGVAEAGQAGPHRAIADEQHRVGLRILRRRIDGQLVERGVNPIPLRQQDSRERRTRPRAFVQRDGANLGPRHAAEQRHAQHRPARRDGDVRDERVAVAAKELDHRNEADVELPRGHAVREAAGQIEREIDLGREVRQPLDDRLGVQVVDRADAELRGHHPRPFPAVVEPSL